MTKRHVTQHAIQRMTQRGLKPDDLDLIMLIGTEVEGGYLVRSRDRQAAESELKRLLKQVRRLDGTRLVVESGTVVTAYRAGRKTERRLVRSAAERDWAA